MVKIIADSTCNLPAEILRQHDIRVAPISIQFGEKTFEEEITIDRDRFYAMIEETGTIIALQDGVLEATENVRTRGRAIERLVELLEESMGTKDPINAAVIHARAPEEARSLADQLRAKLNCKEILEGDLVSSLAVHGGPGVIGAFAYPT